VRIAIGRGSSNANPTLFLDEVGELSPLAQVRLLRFLQEGTIRRVGETRDRKVDVRVVAATHQDLQSGTFRSDLFYRLNVIPIELPPLRARGDDVLVLFGMALRETCVRIGRPVPSLSSAAVGVLRAWSWPGNVRELRNLADQMAVLAGSVVDLADLPPELREAHRDLTTRRVAARRLLGLPAGSRDSGERCGGALERNDGVKARAAQGAGLERTAFPLQAEEARDPGVSVLLLVLPLLATVIDRNRPPAGRRRRRRSPSRGPWVGARKRDVAALMATYREEARRLAAMEPAPADPTDEGHRAPPSRR
jgi:DNA-binding NtrC family response regulator